MQNMKRCTAFVMVLCLLLGYALSVGPMAPDVNAVEYDPYVFILGPESSTVPEYYRDYAKPFVGWSPFEVGNFGICRWFNLTNVDEIQPQEPAGFDEMTLKEKLHASTQAFCADRGTAYHFTYRYRRADLEEAHFAASGTPAALNKAKKIRAIVRHAMPYIANPEVVQAAANAYFGSEKVVTLTNEELASATQAAIWQFSNDLFGEDSPYSWWADFEDPENASYEYEISKCISRYDPLGVYKTERFVYENDWWNSLSGRNINRVYEYLVNLPGEEAYDILIGMNALSLEDMFLEGSGSNCNLTLYIDINGTINEDDDLVLTATCGDQTQTLTIDGSGDQCTADGLYPITFTGVNEADCSRVKLDLTGSQTVEDAVFFEAEPRDGKDAKASSQGFVGMGPSTGPVGCTTTVNPLNNSATMVISKVDEKTGNPLSGVSFDLYKKQAGGDVKVASVVTDANGKAYFAAVDLSNYYFVETGALPGYEAITGNITTDRITNSWNAGALEVSKKLINETPAKPDETFDFSLTLDLSTAPLMGNGISWMTGDYIKSQLVSTKALTWSVSGNTLTADFTLNADETVKIDSIPLGATYTLKENLTQEERALFNVTTKVDNGSAVKSDTAQGTIAAHNAVVFTNSVVTGELKLGELKVSKKLVNTTPAQVGETFDFKITLDLTTADIYDGSLPWVTDEYLMEQVTSDENLTWTKENGKYVAEFTVDAGETITISGIPQGVTYTVEETFEGDKENWFTVTTKVDDDDEKISKLADGTIAEKNAVIFTNTVVTTELEQGNLNVSKHLVNTTPAQVGETFDFKITLDLSTADVYTDPVFWMNDAYLMGKITSDENLDWTEENGKYTATFTVDAEETVIIKGIPYGATYTLEEELDAEGLEKFRVTTQVGNEKAKDGTTATGTISSINAVLFTNTVVDTEVKLGELSVSKKLVNTTPAEVGETFDFKITLDLSTADVYTDPVFWMNDEYLMDQITSTENLTWTKENGKYVAEFTVDAGETITISGIPQGVTYTVEETFEGDKENWFTVTTKVDDDDEKISKLADGTIAEKNAVIFTNTVVTTELKQGDLNVSKHLVNTTPAQVGETFDFKITLDLSTADVYTDPVFWMNDAYLMGKITSDENLDWTKENGKYTATFTVDTEETVIIKGIPYGATYTVEENLTAEDLEWFSVTSQVGNETAKNSSIATGTVSSINAVLFTNTVVSGDELRLGDLEISKKLVNTSPAVVGETFNFKVTLDLSTANAYANAAPWLNDEYLMDQITSTKNLTWTRENGKYTATFTVNAGETVTIKGIAYGVTYTVEEILTAADLEKFTVTSQVNSEAANNSAIAQGTVAQGNAVKFTNTVADSELKLGELKVSKELVNTTPAEVGETFDFKITLDLTTADIYTDPAFWVNDEYLMDQITSTENLTWTKENGKYVAEFTVDAGETVTIDGIAQGVTYTVEEILTAEDRAWFTVTTQVNSETPKDGETAPGSIAEKNAVLFTNTVVSGDDVRVGNLNVSKNLINTTPAVVGETFNFKITLDLSTADAYDNAAPWLDDAYLLGKISSDENLTWTKENGKYTAAFTVDAGETVVIKGVAYGVTYTVEEILTAEDREHFSVTTQVGNEKAKDGETATGSIASINAVLFTNSVFTTEVKLGDLEVSKELINTTPAEVGETFDFKITLDLTTADVYTDSVFWMNDEYLMGQITSTENLTWTKENGKYVAEFTVDAGETVTIDGIAQGVTYTVEEILTAEDRAWFTVTTQVNSETPKDGETASGSIAEKNAVLFTNTVVSGDDVRVGNLNVSKNLINTTPAVVGETFNFKITLDLSTADAYDNAAPWLDDAYLLGKISSSENLTWTKENGKYIATFTVDAGETVVIKDIAYGVTYTVEEILTAEDREHFSVTTQVGNEAPKDGETATGSIARINAVLFTNSVFTTEVKLGDLEVSKELINTTPAEVGETFDFKITLDLTTADVYTDPVFWMNDEYLMDQITSTENLTWTKENGKYVAEFTVDAGETVTIGGIAHGVTYTVEETFEGDKDEWFTVTTKVNDEAEEISELADGTIAEKNAVIFTNTVVTTELKLGDLNVSKKLINTTPAVVGETFNFKITLDLTTADVYTDPVFWMNDEYLMDQITSTENLTWTKENGKYTAAFIVNAEETVSIKGIAQGVTYTVEEILTAEDLAWFSVTTQVGNEAPKNSNTATGAVANINAVLFTNTVVTGDELRVGDLDISKKLINTTPAVVGETFNFKITLDLSTADAYDNAAPWLDDAYLLGKISSSENLTWTKENGKYTATFTVDADETVTLRGIAYGVTYTVEEILTAEDRQWFTVTSQVNSEAPKDSEIATGSVAQGNAVIFTNSVVTAELKLGGLNVSKNLINTTPAEVGETFNFKITLDLSTAEAYDGSIPWMNDEYLIGKVTSDENLTWTKKDGKYTATFTVDAGETVVIKGIAYGATYTVEEIMTAEDREWFTVTSQVGNAAPKNSNTAEGSIAQINAVLFTNTVVTGPELKPAVLTVSKELINTTPAEVGETFNFRITLDLSTADVYVNAAPWMNDGYLMEQISSAEDLTWTEKDSKYTAEFTVNADEAVAIEGIAFGTSYTVEEIMTEEDREWFSVTTQAGEEVPQAAAYARGIVAERNALIFTNTVKSGPELKLGELAVSKKLINTTPAVVGETFNFRITLDLSTADVYVDPAPWMSNAYLMDQITSEENLIWTEQDGKYVADFTVDADETVTIGGIAYGTSYTVEEVLTEEDREWFESNAQIGDTPVEGTSVSGTVAKHNAVIFTNSVVTGPVLETGSVEVSKKLINTTPAEVGETFNFKITLDLSTADVYVNAAPWMNDEYLMSFITGSKELTWTEKDGKYTADFNVNADDTFAITGIACGASYTVEEILTEEDRECFTVTTQIGEEEAVDGTGVSGTVAERNALIFTNTVVTTEVKLGELEVSKKLVNTTPAVVGETFNFKITLDLTTADVYADPVFWINDEYLMSLITGSEELTWTEQDGKYTAEFTVDADETVTIGGIACGTSYTVEEIQTEEDREWFNVTTQIGEEEAVEGTSVEGAVAEKNALIFTNSVVTTELNLGKLEVSKKLINATAANKDEAFNFSIVIDFSKADVYTNAVPWMNNDYLLQQVKSSKELTWAKSGTNTYTATFTLKADEAITIEGIAMGSGYTVQEELTKADRSVYQVTTRITTDGTAAAENKSYVVSGNMAAENAVRFTNKYIQKDVPVTGDFGLTLPMMLCLLSMLAVVTLLLNRRRFL